MKTEPFVSIIMLNWNGWEYTIECLRSLERITYKNYKIVLIDNASTDSSIERIKSLFPNLEIIKSSSNLGFGGGNNIGIRRSIEDNSDYVWLLNNDTTVCTDALTKLVEMAESDPKIGAVGSLIVDSDFPYGVQAWGGGKVSFIFGRAWHLKKPDNIDYLTAASVLIRTSIVETLEGFDSGFFMYWEDVDLSIRIRKLGFSLAVADLSRVYHKESSSLGKKSPLMDAYYNYSATRFFKKHSKIAEIPILFGSLGRTFKRIYEGDYQRAKIVIFETKKALSDNIYVA
ncbi:glycosyltransferase family 2 protein [Deinococcus humi]|uniref:GT2 family glycosyltransferase n=1 Tax=Deinococcus humi TaxID=662880 RepID=A0A7W8JTB7_9DEIO|nr:glycosyltransferase family 2 protein [Deinococcus humi]MBB5361421.1 GT2 family glycosyltransferase [Deinococcus humi]GGO20000.1 rhamnosyltransferase [Deinococcus humi]